MHECNYILPESLGERLGISVPDTVPKSKCWDRWHHITCDPVSKEQHAPNNIFLIE